MKRVFITGGTGALGSAITKRLVGHKHVERIAVYSRDEHKHHRMASEFGVNMRGDDSKLRFFIGDVRDQNRLEHAMRGYDTVIHAAALKVVPAGEYNPMEFVATNIYGAQNVAMACIRSGVQTCVGISTDKACSPVNLYGATKLAAEKTFVASNLYGGGATSFRVCRYGNVTGSTGSVVPIWDECASRRQPLPVTDPYMTRFWMTLEDAVDFVLWTTEHGQDSCVHVPNLKSYVISDLAKAVWASHWGYEDLPGFQIVGMREGEKLHESMVSEDESPWTEFDEDKNVYLISSGKPTGGPAFSFSSDLAQRLSVEYLTNELLAMGWGKRK